MNHRSVVSLALELSQGNADIRRSSPPGALKHQDQAGLLSLKHQDQADLLSLKPQDQAGLHSLKPQDQAGLHP